MNPQKIYDEDDDYVKEMSKPLGIQPHHIRDSDIKKPEGKEPNIVKFLIDKLSGKNSATPAQIKNDNSSSKKKVETDKK